MHEQLFTRRDLVKGGIALGVTTLVPDVLKSPEIQEATHLTYEYALRDSLYFKGLLDSIPEEKRVGVKTQEDLDNWMMEIVPYFEYEGINEDGEVGEYNGLTYPHLDFEDYQDGLLSHHVLGRAQIFADDISLNARIANPVSPWYGRGDSIGTLVHELAHAQGVKFPAPFSDIDEEASAQLVTLEVLSAMANHGNELVVPALLDELYYMNMQAARFIAIRDGYEDRFKKDRERILTDPFEMARAEKADRQWDSYKDPDQYPYILDAYNYKPMNKVYKGMRNKDTVYGVKLPINWLVDLSNSPSSIGSYYPDDKPDYPPYEPGMYAYRLTPQPLIIDDLHYFYDNAEAMTEEVRQL